MSVVVLGTGGHARSCLDVALAAGMDVLGCVGGEPNGSLQVPYLGSDDVLDDLHARGADEAFVAIGANALRRKLSDEARSKGFRLAAIVSPHAYVAPTATVGDGSVIMHSVVVGPYSSVGDGAIVNTGASIDHDCVLGDWVHLAPGTHLAGDVRVDEGAFLGVGVSATPGVSVGAWATVGAGGTVIRDVPGGTTVVGTPAKPSGQTQRGSQ